MMIQFSLAADTYVSREKAEKQAINALIAKHATNGALFALARLDSPAHISSCLSGILSQNFPGPVGNDRAFFLARFRYGNWVFAAARLTALSAPSGCLQVCNSGGRFLGPQDNTGITGQDHTWPRRMQHRWKRER
jgi:hypothetical protein